MPDHSFLVQLARKQIIESANSEIDCLIGAYRLIISTYSYQNEIRLSTIEVLNDEWELEAEISNYLKTEIEDFLKWVNSNNLYSLAQRQEIINDQNWSVYRYH